MQPYYQDESVVIYHGDCREVLPLLSVVDLVLTDPPYGVKMDKGFGGADGFGGAGLPIARRQYTDSWDKERPPKDIFVLILEKSVRALIFGGNYFADILPQGKHWIVWDKLNTMPSFGDCELIWSNVPRNSVKKLIREYNGLIGKEGSFRYHPTQKPLDLMQRLIAAYSTGAVLDPFMGSGTTLVAAKQLGRRAIGIEIEERYCEIAARRCAEPIQDGLFQQVVAEPEPLEQAGLFATAASD